ncbi:MAG: LytR C-terminal domain-containing protein [Gemmatimonadota bacterium]
MKNRLHTLLVVAVLVGVGVLVGSFWLEWRHTRLDAGGPPGVFSGRPATAGRAPLDDRIGVEVLNGAGEKGAAEQVADRLRAMGFDVKTYGNAKRFDYERTTVVDRSGVAGAAAEVADSLGGPPVVHEPRPDLRLDATVILGQDWRSFSGSR